MKKYGIHGKKKFTNVKQRGKQICKRGGTVK
jgi:hypothetical protein